MHVIPVQTMRGIEINKKTEREYKQILPIHI